MASEHSDTINQFYCTWPTILYNGFNFLVNEKKKFFQVILKLLPSRISYIRFAVPLWTFTWRELGSEFFLFSLWLSMLYCVRCVSYQAELMFSLDKIIVTFSHEKKNQLTFLSLQKLIVIVDDQVQEWCHFELKCTNVFRTNP